MDGMNKLTALGGTARSFDAPAEEEWAGKADRRRQLVGIHTPAGVCRRLFGVGEGAAEAVTEAKQRRAGNADCLRRGGRRLAWRSRSTEMVPVSLESASFLRQSPVVNHLSLTCSATCQPLVILVFGAGSIPGYSWDAWTDEE
jgi:hypothetical protein